MGRRVLMGALACVTGCYDPTIPVGLPCGDGCPAGQECVEGFCQLAGGDVDAERADADPTDPDARTRDCWSDWRSGNVAFGTPRPIVELDTGGGEGDPFIASDNRTLFFSTGSPRDFYRAERPSRDAPFGAATPVAELNTTADESRLGMTDDLLLVVIASTRTGGAGLFDLYQAERASPGDSFGPLSATLFTAINDAVAQHDPYLSSDGLRLYYAPQDGGVQTLHVASRTGRDRGFGPATPLAGLAPVIQADPTLSPDERVVVYGATTMTGGAVHLYVATRGNSTGPFSNPTQLDALLTASNERDPSLTRDGCELFYDVAGDLYVVAINP